MQHFATAVLFLLNKEQPSCSLGTGQVTSGLLLDTARISVQLLRCPESAGSTTWIQINTTGKKKKIKKKTTGVTNAFSNSFCSFQRLSKSLCSPVSIPNMPGIYHNTSDWYFIPPHFLSITSERYEKALTKLPLENICSETSIRTVHTYLWWLFWIVSHVKNIYILRHAWPYMSSADVLYK